MLAFAQKGGNTTFYEWRTGKAPTVIERPAVEESLPETVAEDAVSSTVCVLHVDRTIKTTKKQELFCGMFQSLNVHSQQRV